MSSAAEDPRLRACLQIRLRCPECCRDRKLRHRFFCLLAVYVIDDQAESVSKVNERCSNCWTFFCCKYQSCRVFSVSHGKRIHFNADRAVGNCRTHLKHVSLKDSFLARDQIVCIIFHKGGSFCILHALCHDLHNADHSCRLPVALTAEAVAFLHQSLDCKSRKLL